MQKKRGFIKGSRKLAGKFQPRSENPAQQKIYIIKTLIHRHKTPLQIKINKNNR